MMYGYTKEIELSFANAIERVKDELSKEGFGILTEIDVKATLKKKLDVDFEDYVILGACNPPFAHKALLAEFEVGLLLPCNVLVYTKGEKTFISSILPTLAMSGLDNPSLQEIAVEIEEKLKGVIDRA